MRLTVLILGLLLGLLMFIQTVLVGALSSVAGDKANSEAGAVGFVVALIWLVACAFVLPFPLVSVVSFAIAALFSFGAAATSDYQDMYIWGIITLILMVFSFLGWRGKVKDRREKVAERKRQVERDARYEELLNAQQRQTSEQQRMANGVPCHACGNVNSVGTRYCGNCGANLAGSQPGTT